MSQSEENRIVYPPGLREITSDISVDDLVRRLKDCASVFQNMSQEEDNSVYVPLALHFASELFLEHHSRDVRLLTSCCIADVFRLYAPDAPYKDMDQLKVIFEFFIDQLRGLEDPQDPLFKLHFYLLENLSCVKTFLLCFELEDHAVIVHRLFKVMFKTINDNQSTKVKTFMLDMLIPIITELDNISDELLEILFMQIIEPIKSQNNNACSLAQEVFRKSAVSMRPYVIAFFNKALFMGKGVKSDISTRQLYALLCELSIISPSLITELIPQLEFKLKSTNEKERLNITKVLGEMLSNRSSNMYKQDKPLWLAFLARFNDASSDIRIKCVEFAKPMLLNHPDSKDDITEELKNRHLDILESVRLSVVTTIVEAANEDLSSINDELLSFVKQRILDKKFVIRKAAMMGLAQLYKQNFEFARHLPSIEWIKNKTLHMYYQNSLEDKLLVERILYSCLVPFNLPVDRRMKMLYTLFCTVDENAAKCIKEILRNQKQMQMQMKSVLDAIKSENNTLTNKIAVLAKNVPDPSKASQHILKFCEELKGNERLFSTMTDLMRGVVSTKVTQEKWKEILRTLGPPNPGNSYFYTVKQLIERIIPVLLDRESVHFLVGIVKDSLLDEHEIDKELHLESSAYKGLEFLLILSTNFPIYFQAEEINRNLLMFLNSDDDFAVEMTLQILIQITPNYGMRYPDLPEQLIPLLINLSQTGTAKQAKYAVRLLFKVAKDKVKVFGEIITNLKNHFTLESQYFRTALVSVGHIAFLCHTMFMTDLKQIISKVIVQDLLMLDQDFPRGGTELWGPIDALPEETKAKIEGMKVMARWLTGLKNMAQPATSTLRLLSTVIHNGGDLMERRHLSPLENSWMRFTAASCMLKLCQQPKYMEVFALEQFLTLAYVLNDPCIEVCEKIAQKIHKGLQEMKLPLEFLSVFALGGLSNNKDFKIQVKKCLSHNVIKRHDYIKQHNLSNDELLRFLPDYALQYAVYLLAHAPFFTTYNNIESLKSIKDSLHFFMESLRYENYSYSFFKSLLENIKQTKDRQFPEEEEVNLKLYAVCDVAMGVILSQANLVLKDFPAEPLLDSKFFTETNKTYSNMKTYLPEEFLHCFNVKPGFELDIYNSGKVPDTAGASSSKDSEIGDVKKIVKRSSRKRKNSDEDSESADMESRELFIDSADESFVPPITSTNKKGKSKKIVVNNKAAATNVESTTRSKRSKRTRSSNIEPDTPQMTSPESENIKLRAPPARIKATKPELPAKPRGTRSAASARSTSSSTATAKPVITKPKTAKSTEMMTIDELNSKESTALSTRSKATRSMDTPSSSPVKSMPSTKSKANTPEQSTTSPKPKTSTSGARSARTRSSKTTVVDSPLRQNGVSLPSTDVLTDYKDIVKECNVSLDADSVSQYNSESSSRSKKTNSSGKGIFSPIANEASPAVKERPRRKALGERNVTMSNPTETNSEPLESSVDVQKEMEINDIGVKRRRSKNILPEESSNSESSKAVTDAQVNNSSQKRSRLKKDMVNEKSSESSRSANDVPVNNSPQKRARPKKGAGNETSSESSLKSANNLGVNKSPQKRGHAKKVAAKETSSKSLLKPANDVQANNSPQKRGRARNNAANETNSESSLKSANDVQVNNSRQKRARPKKGEVNETSSESTLQSANDMQVNNSPQKRGRSNKNPTNERSSESSSRAANDVQVNNSPQKLGHSKDDATNGTSSESTASPSLKRKREEYSHGTRAVQKRRNDSQEAPSLSPTLSINSTTKSPKKGTTSSKIVKIGTRSKTPSNRLSETPTKINNHLKKNSKDAPSKSNTQKTATKATKVNVASRLNAASRALKSSAQKSKAEVKSTKRRR